MGLNSFTYQIKLKIKTNIISHYKMENRRMTASMLAFVVRCNFSSTALNSDSKCKFGILLSIVVIRMGLNSANRYYIIPIPITVLLSTYELNESL